MKKYKYIFYYTTGQQEEITGNDKMDLKQLRMDGALFVRGNSLVLINIMNIRKIEEIIIEEGVEK